MKKKIKKVAIFSGAVILLLLTAFIFSLNFIIEKQILAYRNKFEKKTGLRLVLSSLNIASYNSISFKNIKIKNTQDTSILELQTVELGINIWSILQKQTRLSKLNIEKVNVFYEKTHPFNNKKSEKELNLNSKLFQLWDRLFAFLPDEFSIKNFNGKFFTSSDTFNLKINKCHLENKQLNFQSELNSYPMNISGLLNPGDRTADLELHFDRSRAFPVPKFINRWNAQIFPQKIKIKINEWDYSENESEFKISSESANFGFYHKKLDKDTIILNNFSCDIELKSNESSVEIDSNSSFMLNKLVFHPYIKYFIDKKDTTFEVKLNLPLTKSQDFFDGLPPKGFSTLTGIQTKGNIKGNLSIKHIIGKPDSLVIKSYLIPEKFQVTKFGNTDYRILNGKFTYHPYYSSRKIVIGEGNYTPLTAINNRLIHSVIQSEDGTFFYHKGFNEGAFLESAKENLKFGYFKRGGSTLTMQLVKNVFLGHQKTIFRKLEEALIVWLIERLGLCSKNRMLEVYLNAIEWGPGVYGIGEASYFYFSKSPSNLTTEESIFLASIIPHPRSFGVFFNPEDGNINKNMMVHYKFIAGKLHSQGIINQKECEQINPDEVVLAPQARKGLRLASGIDRFTKSEGYSKVMEVIKDQKIEPDEIPELPQNIE